MPFYKKSFIIFYIKGNRGQGEMKDNKQLIIVLICFCVILSVLVGAITVILLSSSLGTMNKVDVKQEVHIGDRLDKKDINDATLQDLEAVPNIGEKLAREIISYREENGLIKSINDLKKIKYIGPDRIKLLGEAFKIGKNIRNDCN